MKTLLSFVIFVAIQTVIVESVKVSPKLDFGDQSEFIKVKKEIKSGTIKGLRVTVDTSELKGFLKYLFNKRSALNLSVSIW